MSKKKEQVVEGLVEFLEEENMLDEFNKYANPRNPKAYSSSVLDKFLEWAATPSGGSYWAGANDKWARITRRKKLHNVVISYAELKSYIDEYII